MTHIGRTRAERLLLRTLLLLTALLAGCSASSQQPTGMPVALPATTTVALPATTTAQVAPTAGDPAVPTPFLTPTMALVRPVDRKFYSDPGYLDHILAELQRPGISPEYRRSLEKHLWIADLNAIAYATAVTLPTPIPRGPPPPDPNEPTPFVGIFEGSGGKPPSSITVYNSWYGMIDGFRWIVEAGADLEDPTQGVLVVIKVLERVHFTTDTGRYLAPSKTGGLRVTSVEGMLLHAVAEDGSTYVFDLSQRAFVPGS